MLTTLSGKLLLVRGRLAVATLLQDHEDGASKSRRGPIGTTPARIQPGMAAVIMALDVTEIDGRADAGCW